MSLPNMVVVPMSATKREHSEGAELNSHAVRLSLVEAGLMALRSNSGSSPMSGDRRATSAHG